MNLIRTGIGLTKTIKNVTRLREIISIFARNGFDEFIIKTGIHTIIPEFVLPKSRITEAIEDNIDNNWPSVLGYRLRKSFEELGPCFIKLGQLISTREDMFDSAFIDEMKKLLDQVKGIPYEEAKKIIEKSLDRPVGEIFAELDPVPIGTASIAVVFKGRLLSGEDVVIKVRRPNIVKTINTDVAILHFLAERIENSSKELKYIGLTKLIHDFAANLRVELDFYIESLNCQRLKANIETWDKENIFYLPKVYKEFSRNDILVLEFLDGIPFSQGHRILEFKDIITEKLIKGVHVFIDSLLIDGHFHADLHGGNFFLLKDNRIGVIDFGLTGHLGKKGKSNLIAILNFLVLHSYENLVYEFLDVAEYKEIPDIDELVRDVKDCLVPFVGLTIQQTNFSALIASIIKTLSSHRIYLPREWFIVFRAMMTLDGVGKSLGIDFDIFSIIEKNIRVNVKKLFSQEEMINEGLWASRDFLSSLRIFPRHLKWFLRVFSKNNYSFEIIHKGYEEELRGLQNSIQFFAYCLLSAMLVLSGVVLNKNSFSGGLTSIYPLTWLFWGLAFALFLKGMTLTRVKKSQR